MSDDYLVFIRNREIFVYTFLETIFNKGIVYNSLQMFHMYQLCIVKCNDDQDA